MSVKAGPCDFCRPPLSPRETLYSQDVKVEKKGHAASYITTDFVEFCSNLPTISEEN